MVRRALKFFAFAVLILLLAALAIAAFVFYVEVQTSTFQARELSRLANDLRWDMQNSPNGDSHFSQAGPYDVRLGYSRLPEMFQHLAKHGFQVHSQARVSARMKELVEQGLFIPYREKSQAGLEITAGDGQPLYRAMFPSRIYENFESIPSVVTDSLLFIENRELLDLAHPKKNPAIDWNRLGRAVLDKGIQLFRTEHDVPGGSTLATQIEKYRHSPNGMTMSAKDKLQQIASASVRAYLNGTNTLPARKQIVVDYLNTVPLSAAAGFGETNGIGDGLWAWYGLKFDETNHILNSRFVQGDALIEAAFLYKHILSLMIAQRRPSYYLLGGREELAELTDSYLRVLAQAGVIPSRLRDAALKLPLSFRDTLPRLRKSGIFPSRRLLTRCVCALPLSLGYGGCMTWTAWIYPCKARSTSNCRKKPPICCVGSRILNMRALPGYTDTACWARKIQGKLSTASRFPS